MEEWWGRGKVFFSRMAKFKRRNRLKRYGVPILLIVIVFVLKTNLQHFLGENSTFLFVSFIVAVSSWYGGLGPGIFATSLSAILTYVFFLTQDTSSHPFWGDLAVVVIFLIEGVLISLVSEARFQLEDQKDEFIGFVAHELKNPLAAIKGFSSLLLYYAKKNKDEKLKSYTEKIDYQTDRILALTNDLLDITKIEIGKLSYTENVFAIKDVVKEVIFHQQIVSNDRLIKLHGMSRHLLLADKYRISQVLTNLLINGLKYSPETKGILVTVKDYKEKVVISVKDHGIGIPLKDQSKIFNRFYRVGDTKRTKADGLGLGLYISTQIVQHHKGKLWVKSIEGKGSTFYLELPINHASSSVRLGGLII